jgi:hypothetical protein
MSSFSIPEYVNVFLNTFAKKHAPSISIKQKSQSSLMKVLTFLVKPFNPKFDQYITTIGTTIYLPDNFFNKKPIQVIEILSHETKHAKDFHNHPFLFISGYLFPQILFLPLLILLLVLGCKLWSLFALTLLLPIPAYFRFRFELVAYRTSLLIGENVLIYPPKEIQKIKDWIMEQLTKQWYYWAFPFPSYVRKQLNDSSYKIEPYYLDILQYIKTNKSQLQLNQV